MHDNDEQLELTTPTDYDLAEAPKHTWPTLKRLVGQLAAQKKALIILLTSVLAGIALYSVTPLIMGVAIDRLVNHIQLHGITGSGAALDSILAMPLLLLLAAYLLSSLFAFIQEYTMASVGETLVLTLRKQMSDKINKLPLGYYDSKQTGELLSRVTNDLDRVAEVLTTGASQFLNAVATITISVALMFVLHPLLTLLILLSMAVSLWAASWIAGKNFQVASENQTVLGELNGRIEEFYSGNLILKSFNQQEEAIRIVKEISQRQYKASKKAQFLLYAIYPTIRFLTQTGFVVTAITGGIFVVQGTLTIGTVQAFLQYVNQISEPITQSSYFINSLQTGLASAERVFEFLDEEEEEPDTGESVPGDSPKGTVEFQHVRFGYHPDSLLMKDISFSVNANEMVAIVGPTGAGKTTLVNLLMRFYELNGGTISIDGMDIQTIPKKDLRKRIGIVLQDTWLFKGTIAENIAYGKRDATREEIIQAAKAARCDHFIRTLEHGYDTVLSSEDSSISQGQMQLLTIARAILANPALMILDEATSSVDTRTEAEIQKAMSYVMKGKTSFVIAHRLSTIKSADLILVMKEGNIIEKGTHQQLLNGDTFYADLYNSQFTEPEQ